MVYMPFKKDFYKETSAIANMEVAELNAYKKELDLSVSPGPAAWSSHWHPHSAAEPMDGGR